MTEKCCREGVIPVSDCLSDPRESAEPDGAIQNHTPSDPSQFPEGPFFTDSGNSSSDMDSEEECEGWGNADNGDRGEDSDGEDDGSGGSTCPKMGGIEAGETRESFGGGENASKKKKKRKKKKKKGREEEEIGGEKEVRDKEMLPPLEADARYHTAMESLRAKDEWSLWVQLDKCRISDKKAKKIVEALGESRGITSLDLSHNNITDIGIRHLTQALSEGLVPDLISLDVRGNPMGPSSALALANLQRLRKQCRVDFLGAQDTDSDLDERRPPGGKWVMEAGNGWGEGGGMGRKTPKDTAKEGSAVEKVEAALRAVGGGGAQLGECLEVVLGELRGEEHRVSRAKDVQGLPGGLRQVVRNLPHFLSVLEIAAPPVESQKKVLEPAVGRSRISTLQLVLLLVVPCAKGIDAELVALGVLPRVAALLFAFPWNTAAHVAVAKVVELVLSRPDSPLLPSLLVAQNPPFPQLLAQSGGVAEKEAQGRRLGNTGFVIRLSRLLRSLAKGHPPTKDILDSIPEWKEYSAVGGVLDRLLQEQEGGLGGEKPEAAALLGAGFDSEQVKEAEVMETLSRSYYDHFRWHRRKGH